MGRGNGDREILKILTCGSADAGKSTLLDHLCSEGKVIPEECHEVSPADSGRATVRVGIDLTSILGGRGQGQEFNVAIRHVSTATRDYKIADVPAQAENALSLVAAAFSAQAAVMVVDAHRGVSTEDRRHAVIAGEFGVRRVILAVNKMDLVAFDCRAFEAIAADYKDFVNSIGMETASAVPVAARSGDNVSAPSPRMPWHKGPALLEALEAIELTPSLPAQGFRMPVDDVVLVHGDRQECRGTVTAGSIRVGDDVLVYPTARRGRVKRVGTEGNEVSEAGVGNAVRLELAGAVDIRRGDVVATGPDPTVTDQFAAKLLWLGEQPMIPERQYVLKRGPAESGGAVTELKYRVNTDSLEHIAAKTLDKNELGFCNVALDRPLVMGSFAEDPALGCFILSDRLTKDIVGIGTVAFSLRRATNVRWQDLEIGKAELAAIKSQKPAVIWLTGLSGAGKSTIANLVQKRLHAMGHHTYLLDGDNLRHGINKDLGFVEADRVENIRRVAEVAKLFVDSGTIVLVSLISPYRRERLMAREIVEDDEFIEVFVDTPLTVCEARDPKGLYRKARSGELVNFTGVDAPYEPPESPEITIDGAVGSAEAAADQIVEYLVRRRRISGN